MLPFRIEADDSVFIDRLRGLSILRVLLVHLGLSWFYPPYSYYINTLLPVLFFVSGAVSLPIFLRADSVRIYAVKRTASVLIPYYVIAVVLLAGSFLLISGKTYLSLSELTRWLLVMPKSGDAGFALGQLWFLRSLAIIVLLSLPIYLLSLKRPNLLLVPVFISLILSIIQLYNPINHVFTLAGFNLYQPLVNAGFFFLGSWYYWKGGLPSKLMTIGGVFLVVAAFAAVLYSDMALRIPDHLYSPTFYYLGLSFAAIFFILALKPWIQWVLNNVPLLDRFVLSLSKHAYSVFILHSFAIYAAEEYLGLLNVASDWKLAVTKIVLVISSTILVSIPVTAVTRRLSKKVTARFTSNQPLHSTVKPQI